MIRPAFSWKKNVAVNVCIILLCILGTVHCLFMTGAVVVKFEYDKAAHFPFHFKCIVNLC